CVVSLVALRQKVAVAITHGCTCMSVNSASDDAASLESFAKPLSPSRFLPSHAVKSVLPSATTSGWSLSCQAFDRLADAATDRLSHGVSNTRVETKRTAS